MKKSSPKQIKQRKLASQLWQLTGTIGAVKNLTWRTDHQLTGLYLLAARKHLENAEKLLREQMKEIK